MTNNLNQMIKSALIIGAMTSISPFANASEEQPADMSDPMAVYNQLGGGITDRGLNVKYGQAYDTGSDVTMGMNVVEIKGIAGNSLGWSDTVEPDDSIDSFRFRNFNVDLLNGQGKQFDINYDVERESIDASYSLMQALPKMGGINLYPLVGLGVNIQNNAIETINNGQPVVDSGYSLPGVFGLVGMYGKWALTDQIWLNYNPMFLSTLGGSDFYKNNAYGVDNGNMLAHEVIASYQVNPRLNFRYFANFNDEVSFKDGEHRIEFNYQF
ncbi:hypothetical protein [uncultured Vibrio sp.]|uniref:hypothetical protein n=1 Tax=uncultured Vibrio sp. TaxID=114054 RepID=UPI0025DE0D2F|nr:hypothetical protein [uncultured Vibrio sp.]